MQDRSSFRELLGSLLVVLPGGCGRCRLARFRAGDVFTANRFKAVTQAVCVRVRVRYSGEVRVLYREDCEAALEFVQFEAALVPVKPRRILWH